MIAARWNLILLALFYKASVIEGVSFVPSVPIDVRLDENLPPGTFVTQVQASASNPPAPGPIIYSLDGPDKDWFRINDTNGVITVAKTLDAEVKGVLQFIATASKNSETPASKRVIVQLTDLNDNIPQFVNLPYEVSISESTRVDQVVFAVSVTDEDLGGSNSYNLVSFNITGGNTNGTFEIGGHVPNVGDIVLKKPLDFESSTKVYYLNVTATDDYGKGNQNWTIVTIRVTNADDNPVIFLQYLYEVLIDSNTPKGYEIVKVHAEDKDLENVSYEIYPASNPENTFMINNLTGSVTINRNLTQTTYHLIVTASSQSASSNTPAAFSLVIVNVGAMPNRTFESSVMENEANTIVMDLKPVEEYFKVSDPLFEILQGDEENKFVINQTTKELRVGAQGLDRESRVQYILVVELRSNGINKGFAKIVVNVVDANDNAPEFQSPASVSISEDTSPGTVILTVSATDEDLGENGTVVYEIVGGNEQGFFALNNHSGTLSLSRPLDYETAVQHVLNISASDLGESRLQTFSDVTVNVTDANDNSPVLQPRTVQVSLLEGIAPGSYVTQCNATDADAGANADITYHIVEGSANKFSINNNTGVITTTAQLDRESGVSEYVLIVKAEDKGQHPRADIGFVTVSVTNRNEHSPVISPVSYIGGVYRDMTHYSLVTTVKATDADSDSDSDIFYNLVNGDGAELFHVESDTGHVRVASSLAEEKRSKYTLEVSASDGMKVSTNNAVVGIFVLLDEDSIILTAGVTPQEITSRRQEFLGMLETITGGKAFIKYLQKEDGKNVTLVTFHVVRSEQVLPGSEIISSFTANRELLDSTYKRWNIQRYQSPTPSVPEARKGNEDEGLSAVVGAMICLGVIIGVGAIIMIVILIRRKQTGQRPFKKRRQTRVKFNDSPFYIDPDHSAVATNQVDSAQEAQEVIVHLPPEDNSSLDGSDTSSQSDVVHFVNFGYAARMVVSKEADPSELDDSHHLESFFPPPPIGPPPPPPDSDSDEDNNEIVDASEVYGSEFETGEDNLEIYRPDDEGDVAGIVLSQSPTESTTGSTDQLVTDGPKVAHNGGSFLKRFSLNEGATDL